MYRASSTLECRGTMYSVKVTPSPAYNDLQAGERVSRQQQSAEQQYNAPSNIDTQQQASRSIMNSIKTKMSSKGGREDLQDVDFHYITERIIAIAFPDGGLDSTYKASLREVTRMLQTKHDEKHMIFNLSERRYDIPKLNKHVMDFGWPDHLAPPLENLCSICKSIDSWLSSDPQHVAVLHCKGSTGRMGVVVASYMHYCNICASADNALDRFAMKRYYDNKLAFATHPSQRRYIQYFSGLLSGNIKMNNQPLYLHQVVIYGAPNFDLKGGCRPFIKVYQGMQPVYTSGVYMPSDGTNRITLAVDPVLQLRGDILVKCYHKTSRVASRDVIFCLQFHTCAVATDRLLLRKEELDGACIDSRFPDHGKVEVMLSSVPDRVFTDLDAIPVDTSMDALVRADSYENFNVHPEDGGEEEEITHTQGPVDGSLYAEVTKRKPASSATNEEVQNGPHVSMDSGISSSSGQTGQYNTTLQIAVTPKHSHVVANSNSNPPPLQRPDNAPSPKQGLNTAQASNLDALLNDMLESAGLDREQVGLHDVMNYRAEAESSKSYNQVYRLTTTTSSDKYSNGPSVTPSSPPKPPIRLEGMSRGEGPAPGREDEQAHATWLLAQKQKLRARQEGKDWDEGTAKALVSELRDVQTRMRRSESDRQEREMFTDNQLLIETGGAAAASPPSQTSPYTASKPPIYQAPRLGSAPSSPMSRRANSPQQQQQPPPRAWQSHQRPLQRQHSDTSFDRDRDHPAVAPPVARTRAGSASQMSPPLSPGSERYYQNINQYAVPSTNTTERRQVDTSTLVYKQKIEDDMQALLDSLQETAQSARDESSLRREGVSSQYRSQRPVEMETPIASSSAQRAETQPVYAQPSQPFSSGQPTTPVVLTQDDIARKMSGLATEEPITREVAPRKSQAVRVLQPQPIRTAPVAAPLPTDMYDGHANQTTTERSSMSKRQQQQANSSSSHHQYQQQQQWSQQSQDRNQSMNRQEVNPREQSPFLEQTVVRQELPPQQHPREQQQPPPLREVYSPGYASQQQQQLPQQQQLQQQQQQQQQQQARVNQEYRFQQESRRVQHDQRSQRGYSPTKVDDLERGLQLAADRTGKGIAIQSGNQQDGGFNDVITMTARLANDRSTTESLPRSVQAEVHAAPERAPPPERPPPPDRPETPSFPVTPATPYQNRRQLDTNTEQHVRMQQMAGGSQQYQHHTQQQQQQHHTQQQHQDHTQQRHDQQFGVQQQISPIRLDMERDRPTTPAFPVMPVTPYMNRGMSPVATHGGESMTTNRVEYSYGRTQRSYQSGQQEALRGGIATSPRSPPLMGGDRGTSPIRGEIVPGSQGSPGSFYQGGSRRSSISSVDTLEVIRHHPVFVKDVSSYWYKPDISREQAINMLKERPPGTFVVRDSNSFPGAFGLAVKVAQPPPNVQHKMGDVSNELVRHFLIEPTAKGVRLKGCANEPVFGSLSALVYQHSITALALPCKLIIPEIVSLPGILPDPAVETASESEHGLPSTASALLAQGAACNVLYLSSYETESLTGPQAVRRAMGLLSLQGQIVPTVVHFKVSGQGITLTDNNRKLFFRRHYPVNTVTYCGMDPEDRRWTQPSRDTGMPMNAKCYGFIARKTGSKTDNACHLFAELDPDQPASAIVNFVSKVMIAHMNKV